MPERHFASPCASLPCFFAAHLLAVASTRKGRASSCRRRRGAARARTGGRPPERRSPASTCPEPQHGTDQRRAMPSRRQARGTASVGARDAEFLRGAKEKLRVLRGGSTSTRGHSHARFIATNRARGSTEPLRARNDGLDVRLSRYIFELSQYYGDPMRHIPDEHGHDPDFLEEDCGPSPFLFGGRGGGRGPGGPAPGGPGGGRGRGGPPFGRAGGLRSRWLRSRRPR